jgi:hypothetical protein
MSRKPAPLGRDPSLASPVTPGAWGHNDAADPRTPSWFVGDTPGTLGIGDYADPRYANAPKFAWSDRTLYASSGLLMVPASVAAATTVNLPAVVEGTAYIAADAHPRAGDFYQTFPLEPILPSGHFKVKSVVSIKGLTIDGLLGEIIKRKSTDVMIVSHGHGGGLAAPLVAGSDEPLGIKAMQVFAGELPEDNLPIGARALAALKQKIAQVKRMNIRSVVLRACVVGEFPEVLDMLKKFFNCQVVDAPKALDGYGRVGLGTPTRNPDVWEKWLADNPGATVEFASPNRFAWIEHFPSLMAGVLAESDMAIKTWVDGHLPGSVKKISRSLTYHALNAGSTIVFPGDSDYRSYLNRTP